MQCSSIQFIVVPYSALWEGRQTFLPAPTVGVKDHRDTTLYKLRRKEEIISPAPAPAPAPDPSPAPAPSHGLTSPVSSDVRPHKEQ